MDKDQNPNVGGEYQYSGDQYNAASYGDVSSGGNGMPDKSKRLIAIVAVLVVLFVGYKIATVYINRTHKDTGITMLQTGAPATGLATAIPTNMPVATHAANNVVSQNFSKSLEDVADMKSEVSNHLTALEQQTSNTSSQLEQVNLNISSLNVSISNMSTTLAGISSNLQALSNEIGQIQQTQKQQATAIKQQQALEKKRQAVTYYIQSMIPGRAWLGASDGATLTVSQGDTLPNYGNVDKIDDKLGVIVTSSGKILHYGIKED